MKLYTPPNQNISNTAPAGSFTPPSKENRGKFSNNLLACIGILLLVLPTLLQFFLFYLPPTLNTALSPRLTSTPDRNYTVSTCMCVVRNFLLFIKMRLRTVCWLLEVCGEHFHYGIEHYIANGGGGGL